MLFQKFLQAYIQDLIECSSDNYKITEEQKEEIAAIVESNEYLWVEIDNAVFQELEKYKVENGGEENND